MLISRTILNVLNRQWFLGVLLMQSLPLLSGLFNQRRSESAWPDGTWVLAPDERIAKIASLVKEGSSGCLIVKNMMAFLNFEAKFHFRAEFKFHCCKGALVVDCFRFEL